jgi:hypothetical protein
VVVRVGKDPERGVSTMRTLGIGLVVAGLVLALAGLILGRSKRRPAPAAPAGSIWMPAGGPPPVAPPQAGAPTQPPYVAPPPQYPPQGYPRQPPGSGRPLPPPPPPVR